MKTRLHPLLGAGGAARLYDALVRDTARTLARWRGGRATWVVDGAGDHPLFRGRETWPQGGGDLGARLERAVARAFREGAGAVGVIGTDCPLLGTSHLARMFGAADGPRTAAVIPATDGGYTGLALGSPCPAAFRGIAWSTPRVLGQTLEVLAREGFRTTRLPPLSDLDTPEDLARLREALCRAPHLAPHTARALGVLTRENAPIPSDGPARLPPNPRVGPGTEGGVDFAGPGTGCSGGAPGPRAFPQGGGLKQDKGRKPKQRL